MEEDDVRLMFYLTLTKTVQNVNIQLLFLRNKTELLIKSLFFAFSLLFLWRYNLYKMHRLYVFHLMSFDKTRHRILPVLENFSSSSFPGNTVQISRVKLCSDFCHHSCVLPVLDFIQMESYNVYSFAVTFFCSI